MFYVLKCIKYSGGYLKIIDQEPEIKGVQFGAFDSGVKIDVPVPQPIVFELDPMVKGDMPIFFNNPYPIMHEDFITTLIDFGINNIDCYDVMIHDKDTGEKWENYKIVNIIGVVSAANMDKSEYDDTQSQLISVLFDRLVIDSNKTYGLNIFRLAQKLSVILVSESLKNYIESFERYDHVVFIKPEEFAG